MKDVVMPLSEHPRHPEGSFRGGAEVAAAFLKLGLTSFGGPIAHIGYFHREFVERRRWIDEEHFAQLIGLCQFLPGPASSQVAFSLGLLRAGWIGALAAFIGFTLPSALLMFALAVSSNYFASAWGQAVFHGFKLVAVAVVAQGLLGMARRLTPDAPRALIAAGAAGLIALGGHSWMQLLVIAVGAALGPWFCHGVTAHPSGSFTLRYGRRTGTALVSLFAVLLIIALTLTPFMSRMGQVAAAFYRTGALVFGGGHVVLPLLKHAVVDPGWIDDGTFLAGYGAAQAVPGPMFAVSAYLGERIFGGQGGALGAAVSLLAIFLPGLLIVSGALPFWQALSARDLTTRILAGVNAAVVGLLAAALYNPVWLSAVHDSKDFAIVLMGFVFLVGVRWPAWIAVLWCVMSSLAFMAF